MFSITKIALIGLFCFIASVMAAPCKPCNNGPNGKPDLGDRAMIFHNPAPSGTELPVQVDIFITDGSAKVVAEAEPEGCTSFEKRDEIVECPGCPVKACL